MRKLSVVSSAFLACSLAALVVPLANAVAGPLADGAAVQSNTVAPPAATTKFTTTLFSVYAKDSCADTTPNNYLSIGLMTCNGSAGQNFVFRPVAGSPGSYIITSAASGQCLQDYRSEVRQGSCNLTQSNRQYETWTLQAVDAATQDYQIVQTLSSGYVQCMNATPASTPPFVIWLAACKQGAASQVFNIEGVPQ